MCDDERFRAARELLHGRFGFRDFRPSQSAVVRAVLRGRDVLAVLPTGAGKSLCYQLPALLEPGLTVVVSPLISLMEDQVAGALRRGLPAACLTSSMKPRRRARVEAAVRRGGIRLLYVAPERLETRRLLELLERRMVSRVAVDEAHCIAEWGHDFRPAYRRIAKFRRRVGSPPALALTATATPATRAEIVHSLELRRPVRLVSRVDRPNLGWGALRAPDPGAAARRVIAELRTTPGAAIVYVATRRRAVRLAAAFRRCGCQAAAYHAGLAAATRSEVQEAFLGGALRIVCATNAFGLGIDRQDVRTVCHLGMPGSLEAYVQEAGRAGRDGRPARCLLVACPGDVPLQRAFARRRWPSGRLLARVWDALPEGRATRMEELAETRFRRLDPERIASAARLIVEFGGARWAAGGQAVVRGPERDRRRLEFEAVRRGRRRAERRLREMRAYLLTRRCRRARIAAYFEEPVPPCAGCDRCGEQKRTPPGS
ncbi:MAG: RecQ family ATP-dependent DNA helicase [Gemmatimonadota bacterium]